MEVRFADKKRKDNIPLSMIPPGLIGIKEEGGSGSNGPQLL